MQQRCAGALCPHLFLREQRETMCLLAHITTLLGA